MCPLVQVLQKNPQFFTLVCVTGQHRQMLDQVLDCFHMKPDYDFSIMRPNQTLFDVTIHILEQMQNLLQEERPDLVLVHGDTSTAFTTALACFYLKNSSWPCGSWSAVLPNG